MNSWYVLMIYCVIFLILVVLTIVFLWKFILALVKKKLNQRIVICFLLSIGMLGVVIVFGCSHSTYYKYNDWFILGNSISAVEKRYGKFDLDNKKGEVGYYIYTDNGPVMPDYLKHYYYLEYDEDGIVYRVYEAVSPGG